MPEGWLIVLALLLLVAIVIVWLVKSGWLKKIGVSAFGKFGISLEGQRREEQWKVVKSFDVKKGDSRNEGQELIPFQTRTQWRIRYGTRPKSPDENGHFTVRVSRNESQRFRREKTPSREWSITVVDLRQPDKVRSQGQVLDERGAFLVQVDAKTEWWTLTIEVRQ